MSACVADTQAVIWYLLNDPRLSPNALAALQNAAAAGEAVFVSASSHNFALHSTPGICP